jgi:hypothetical protein
LLDTNVVSELFKGARANPAVINWMAHTDENALYLSVVTLGEISKGIALAEAKGRDMSMQRDFLERALPERFDQRILPLTADAALLWGHLLQRLSGNRQEERVLAIDAQIAATAETFPLRLCSRNTRDFARLGVTGVLDPFLTA